MTKGREDHGTKKIFGVLLPDWIDEDVLKKLVYSFFGLVVAILVSSVFVWPRFADLYLEEKDLAKLEESLETLSNSIDRVQEFGSDLTDNDMAILQMAVPKAFDPGLILSSLRQTSLRAGVILEAYEVGSGVVDVGIDADIDKKAAKTKKGAGSVFQSHKVILRLVGKPDNLIRFIDLLGNSLPISVISELSLSEVSKLFTRQGVSQLEMEVTYFEMGSVKTEINKVAGFTEEERRLLDEIMFYFKPTVVQGDGVGQVGRRGGSIFGF